MKSKRTERIEALLTDAFSPDYLLVKDQSHLHAGHAGAEDGRGHFDVTISSDALSGCGRLQAHRLVYAALGSLMETDVHALSIQVRTASGEKPK
jgi:BolA protein